MESKKYLLAVDLEGANGVVGEPFAGLKPGMAEYDKAVLKVTNEVNAAIEGLYEAGANEVLVWDNHGNLNNLDFSKVDSRAQKVFPKSNSIGRLEFLKGGGFEAMAFIGYHAKEGAINGVLAHTYDSAGIQYYKIDGKQVGEYDIDGMIARAFGVPTIFLSSDDVCVKAFKENFPDALTVTTKIGKGRNEAEFKDEQEVLADIRKTIPEACKRIPKVPDEDFPCTMEIRYTRTEVAREKMNALTEKGIRVVYGEDAHVLLGVAKDVNELRAFL